MSLRNLPSNTQPNRTPPKKRKKSYKFHTFKIESTESSTHDRVIGSCRLIKT